MILLHLELHAESYTECCFFLWLPKYARTFWKVSPIQLSFGCFSSCKSVNCQRKVKIARKQQKKKVKSSIVVSNVLLTFMLHLFINAWSAYGVTLFLVLWPKTQWYKWEFLYWLQWSLDIFFLSNLDVFVKEQMLFLPQWVWQGHLAGEQAVLRNSCGHN